MSLTKVTYDAILELEDSTSLVATDDGNENLMLTLGSS